MTEVVMQNEGESRAGLSAGRQPSLVPFRRGSIAPGQAQQLLHASQQQAAEKRTGIAEGLSATSSVEAAMEAAQEEADGTALADQVGHTALDQYTMPCWRKSSQNTEVMLSPVCSVGKSCSQMSWVPQTRLRRSSARWRRL